MTKVLIINSCKECRHCINGEALARALNRQEEFKGKKACEKLTQFLQNPNVIPVNCPLEDIKTQEAKAVEPKQEQSPVIQPAAQRQNQQYRK
jgi:hypothetical protein